MVAPVVFKLLAGVVTRKGHARYLEMAKKLVKEMKGSGEIAKLTVTQKQKFKNDFVNFVNKTLSNPKASQGYQQGLTVSQVKKDMKSALKELDKIDDIILKGGFPTGRQGVKLGTQLRDDLKYSRATSAIAKTNKKKELAAYDKLVREREKINKSKKFRNKVTKKY